MSGLNVGSENQTGRTLERGKVRAEAEEKNIRTSLPRHPYRIYNIDRALRGCPFSMYAFLGQI